MAAILGISPWATAKDIFNEKTSKEDPIEKTSHVMELGKKFEPAARCYFEIYSDKDFPATIVQMEEYPFMRASLDGWSECKREILEIKYVGKKYKLPEHYIAQMQHQLLVTNTEVCHYQTYNIIDDKCVPHMPTAVYPDKAYQVKILEKCIEFWNAVLASA